MATRIKIAPRATGKLRVNCGSPRVLILLVGLVLTGTSVNVLPQTRATRALGFKWVPQVGHTLSLVCLFFGSFCFTLLGCKSRNIITFNDKIDFTDDKSRIYIHFPFCKSRCDYCDFNTSAGMEKYFRFTGMPAERDPSQRCLPAGTFRGQLDLCRRGNPFLFSVTLFK